MTSITGECCGNGRDQLVYNIEYLAFEQLPNDAIADLRPSGLQPLIISEVADWHVAPRFTHSLPAKRARDWGKTVQAPVFTTRMIANNPPMPQRIAWLDFPNVDGRPELSFLNQHYSIVGQRRYNRGGYELRAFLMVRKDGDSLPAKAPVSPLR